MLLFNELLCLLWGAFLPFGNTVFEKVFEFSHLKQNKKRLLLKASLDRMTFFDEFMRQQFRLYIREIFQLENNTSREEGNLWGLETDCSG